MLDSGVITLRLMGQLACKYSRLSFASATTNKNNVPLCILNYITVQGQTPNDLLHPRYVLLNNDLMILSTNLFPKTAHLH